MIEKLPFIAGALAVAGLLGGGSAYALHERSKAQLMAESNESLSGSLGQMQQEVNALRQQIADLTATRAQAPAPAPKPVPERRPVRRAHSISKVIVRPPQQPTEDPRIPQMQAELAAEQQQLAGTRQDLDNARAELNGRLDSTRDQLSTTIAKNHDELVELEKRGERNYFEFQLDKSKNFDRVGPIRLSLRKADTKHDSFNLAMMVDDNQLQKKNISLYEPLRIDVDGESLEVVVNQISKNHIQGYVSEPKYKKSVERTSLGNVSGVQAGNEHP